MYNSFSDKGYMMVKIKSVAEEWHLCEMSILDKTDEQSFFVDYEDGKIFIVSGDDKSIIGTYEKNEKATNPDEFLVLDYPSQCVIGRICGELIYFRRRDEDPGVGRYRPEEECLAYFTQNGSITAKSVLPNWGYINGSIIGGAASFVALFYNYNFKSVFRDYYTMNEGSFKEKYASYLNPLGL